MVFAVVIKTETYFLDTQNKLNRDKVDSFSSWISYLDLRSYDEQHGWNPISDDIDWTYSVWKLEKRIKATILSKNT